MDGFGPDRRRNRPVLVTDRRRHGIEPLYWQIGGEDPQNNRMDIGQYAQIVNSDEFSLRAIFRIAADLTSETNPLLNPPENYSVGHALDSPHDGNPNEGIAPNNQGVPLGHQRESDPRPVLNRFFTNYVNNRRGREEEDRSWAAIDSTYGDDHIGTELTPAGFFLANFLFNISPPALGSIREEKRILEILINNDE